MNIGDIVTCKASEFLGVPEASGPILQIQGDFAEVDFQAHTGIENDIGWVHLPTGQAAILDSAGFTVCP
jgi:hypothetical protein